MLIRHYIPFLFGVVIVFSSCSWQHKDQSAENSPAMTHQSDWQSWSCQEGLVMLVLENNKLQDSSKKEFITLEWQGKTHLMERKPSASGVLYVDDVLAWHTKGKSGLLQKVNSNKVLSECHLSPSTKNSDKVYPAN